MTDILRAALSDHDSESPLTPTELRTLASEMENYLVENEMQFTHPDWRYVDGLRATASALELAVDPSRSTPSEVDPVVSALLSDNERLRALVNATSSTLSVVRNPSESSTTDSRRETPK